jgi:hypothetical protein
MSDRLSELEARLERVEEAVRALSRGVPPHRSLPGELAAPPAPGLALARDGPDGLALLTLSGRTLMVLGGAFLLRALTDSGHVPLRFGVVLGLAYAALWLGAAERAGGRRALSGLFHGLAAVLIAIPIIWEASTHFALLSRQASAAILTAVSGIALAVSWHRRLQMLAGVVVLGSIAAAAAFIVRTGGPLPFAVGLLVLSVETLWIAETCGWSWLLWPLALASDALIAGLSARASVTIPLESPAAVIGLQAAIVVIYGGFMAWRTLVGHDELRWFEILQVPLSLVVGLAGALNVTGAHFPVLHTVTGLVTIGIAAAGYAAAFGALRRTAPAFGFYLLLSLSLTLAGVAAATSGSWRTVSFVALAMAAAWLGRAVGQPTLLLHAGAFAVAAGLSAGLMGTILSSWFTLGGWAPIGGLEVMALFAALVCAMLAGSGAGSSRTARASRVLLALYLVCGFGALGVRAASTLVGDAFAVPPDVAVIRTAAVSIAALALARLGRTARFVEFGWLVYPMLGAGAISLALQLPHSTPGTLFIALGVYGGGLILAPRIARRHAG